MKYFFQKGISAIELLIIVVVLGIIFSILVPQFSKTRELQIFKNSVSDILSSLNKARSQTLASVDSSSYGVHFQSDKVIIFKGTNFISNDVDNETIDVTAPATISNGTLILPVNIYFNRLSGSPNVTGTITVSTASYSKIITINPTGLASSN